MTTGSNGYAARAASAFNRRDLEAMLALVSEDVGYFDGIGIQTGREAMHKRELALLEAFPDAKVILSPFVVTDDRLALIVFLTGTFTAPLVQGESVNILLNFTQFFETRIEYRFQIFTAHSCDFLLPSYARLA